MCARLRCGLLNRGCGHAGRAGVLTAAAGPAPVTPPNCPPGTRCSARCAGLQVRGGAETSLLKGSPDVDAPGAPARHQPIARCHCAGLALRGDPAGVASTLARVGGPSLAKRQGARTAEACIFLGCKLRKQPKRIVCSPGGGAAGGVRRWMRCLRSGSACRCITKASPPMPTRCTTGLIREPLAGLFWSATTTTRGSMLNGCTSPARPHQARPAWS